MRGPGGAPARTLDPHPIVAQRVTLYFTKTGKTTTDFWKGIYEAYNSNVDATKQSIMEVEVVTTRYEFLVKEGEQ